MVLLISAQRESTTFFPFTIMHPVWPRPRHISPHLQFLFDNAPAADPDKVISVTCGGPHIENVSAGRKNETEYGQRFIFVCIRVSVSPHTCYSQRTTVYSQAVRCVEALALWPLDTLGNRNPSRQRTWMAISDQSSQIEAIGWAFTHHLY